MSNKDTAIQIVHEWLDTIGVGSNPESDDKLINAITAALAEKDREIERLSQHKTALDIIGPSFGRLASCPVCKGERFTHDGTGFECESCSNTGCREGYEAKIISERDEARSNLAEALKYLNEYVAHYGAWEHVDHLFKSRIQEQKGGAK